MLKCYFNRVLFPEELWCPDHWHPLRYFKHMPWDHPLIPEIIKSVDNTEFIGPDLVESPVFGRVSFDRLSGSCKTLLCMIAVPQFFYKSSWMGDNCAECLEKLSYMQDIQLLCVHNFHFTDTQVMEFPQYGESCVGARAFRDTYRRHPDDFLCDPR